MSQFLKAAYEILSKAQEALPPEEITARAVALDLVRSSGKTPSQTMKSKLSMDILRQGDSSVFMRTQAGRFGLREWRREGTEEYLATRYAKALLNEDAMVFPAKSLKKYVPRPGLHTIDPSLGKQLLDECRPYLRRDAEEDTSVIQLVSGFIVQYQDQVLTYKRTKRLPESRLHGEFSLLFGGHLNPNDMAPLLNLFEPEYFWFMARELREELRLKNPYAMDLRGILFDDNRPVSRQHLAIVFDVILSDPAYEVGERGFLQQDKFETWPDVGNRLTDFENWSQLLWHTYVAEGQLLG